MKKILIGVALLSVCSAYAGDLKAPFSLPSARVLPKGVRNLSYKGLMVTAENKFNADGTSLVLADPFFKNITFGDAIKGKLDPIDQGSLTQAMLSVGADEDTSFGRTTGQVNIKATANVPVFAWGISRKLTLAMAVPVIQSSLNVSTGVIQENANLHNEMKALLASKGVDSKIAEFDDKMSNPINSKLSDYGYDPLLNEDKTELGDIKLVAKYSLTDNKKERIVISSDVTLATGTDQDINKVVQVTSGDDQYDVGVSLAHDYILTDTLTLSSSAGYTFQFKDENPERIPMFDDSKVTPDVDLNTSRDLGDVVIGAVAGKFRHEGWKVETGYTYQYKQSDKYSGEVFSSERYNWLEQNTEQEMHTVQLIAGFDTLSLFKKKKFPVPLSLTVNHTQVVKGKNVVNDPLTSVDFSMFF
ncbi:MAG: hypothetical protein HOJ35_13255 [Bdellovibrionales bacterium]|jgi:hypothetical protein|nr:hypothetical protein [Bdellovibrionales bacterium]